MQSLFRCESAASNAGWGGGGMRQQGGFMVETGCGIFQGESCGRGSRIGYMHVSACLRLLPSGGVSVSRFACG